MSARISPLNVLIVGAGHYSTGSTVLEGKVSTDKDFGVLLPSVLELRKQGLVGDVLLAGRDAAKLAPLKAKFAVLGEKFGWDATFGIFPESGFDEHAHRAAIARLPKPGLVLISTPDHTHFEIMRDCIMAGLHFMVVKPAVARLDELYQLLAAMKSKPVLALVDYHKVYDEANLILRDEYRRGRYGDIQHVLSVMTQRRDMLTAFGSWAARSGHNINHYLGSHYIHMTGFITGATPLNVRATRQYGIAKNRHGLDTPDLVQTQVIWRAVNGGEFTSYHVAGWADPSESPSMTYQEIHLIGTNGRVDSDQRHRGFETVLVGEGVQVRNPYFFYPHADLLGPLNLAGQYGFRSVETLVKAARMVEAGTPPASFDEALPTLRESRNVTAILEAADTSLDQGSAVIPLTLESWT